MAHLKPGELASRRAVLPQSASLAFDLEAHVVVGMGSYPFPDLPPSAVRALVDEALAIAKVGELAGRRYASLSGGEQQRVQFARVLVQLLASRAPGQYRALFLDEPTASLDPKHQIGLLQAVWNLSRDRGIASLVVLHDVNLAAAWCDRLLLLGAGRSIALDTPAATLTPANLERAYEVPVSVLPHPLRPAQPLVLFG
jgi:iron complex transport system ATP-binding protein